MATKTKAENVDTVEKAENAPAEGTTAGEGINLSDVQAQIDAMKAEVLAQAKAEAAKIIADAKASVSGEMTAEQKKKAEKEEAYYNEEVEIELFKDNGKYKDDLFVAVNGVGCLIQRGKKVKVKRKYALAIENALKQNRKAYDFMELKVRECQDAESKL